MENDEVETQEGAPKQRPSKKKRAGEADRFPENGSVGHHRESLPTHYSQQKVTRPMTESRGNPCDSLPFFERAETCKTITIRRKTKKTGLGEIVIVGSQRPML